MDHLVAVRVMMAWWDGRGEGGEGLCKMGTCKWKEYRLKALNIRQCCYLMRLLFVFPRFHATKSCLLF